MTYVHLHGLVPKHCTFQGDAPQHRLIDCGQVGALVSQFPDLSTFDALPPERLADWALMHHKILTVYCAETAVLPMRLGSVFSSEQAVSIEVGSHALQHENTLMVLGCLREYTVQLVVQNDAPPSHNTAPVSGRAFLLRQRAERDCRKSCMTDRKIFARKILENLECDVFQVAPANAPRPELILDAAVLVPLSKIDSLGQMARNLHAPAKELGLDLVVSGPWPPYSCDPATLLSAGELHGH